MITNGTGTIGVLLAAGASTRMGRPKALLPGPDGPPLAAIQAARLRAAGCTETLIVLGADADTIAPSLAGEAVLVNPDWPRGRCTSVQAALRARPRAAGYVILPVDNALVRTSTLRDLLAAVRPGDQVVRPWCRDDPGRVIWLGGNAVRQVVAASADTRLDDLLRPLERRVAVLDPGAGSDLNTPQDWQAARVALAKWASNW